VNALLLALLLQGIPLEEAPAAAAAPAVPDSAVAAVVCDDPAALWDALTAGPAALRLREAGLDALLLERPQAAQARMALAAVTSGVGGDPRAWLEAVAGDGVTLVLLPGTGDDGDTALALWARSRDAAWRRAALAPIVAFLGGDASALAEPRGELALGEAHLAWDGDVLVAASDAGSLDALLAAGGRAGAAPDAVSDARRATALAAVPGHPEAVRAWADAAWLRRQDPPPPLPDDLGGSLLFGDLHAAWVDAPWVAAVLTTDGAALEARLVLPEPDGFAETHAPYLPEPVAALWPRPADALGRLVLRRDFARWYTARDAYAMPEAVASSVEGEGQLRLLLGRDFGADFLPWLEPWLVVAADLRPDAPPLEGELPAFALGVRFREGTPEGVPQSLVNAFMAAITFVNFENRSGDEVFLQLDLDPMEGGMVYRAVHPNVGGDERAPFRNNFEPELYLGADGTVWLTSSPGTVARLLAAATDPAPGDGLALELDASSVAALLERNRDAFVAIRTLREGGDVERAARFVDRALALAAAAPDASLRSRVADGRAELVLTLTSAVGAEEEERP